MVPKFLATLDVTGKPNVVPIITLDAADERTLMFGELFLWKTKSNLETDPRVGVVVVTEDFRVWTIRGRFREFVDGGPYVERLNEKEMFRYNAYVGISRAGVIDVEEVTGEWKLSTLKIAAELLPAKAARCFVRGSGGKRLPSRVAEKFARTQAVKVIAFQGPAGYPQIVPLFSLLPARSQTMIFGTRLFAGPLRDLHSDAQVAASVITMDPIAYQIKGVYTGRRFTPAGRIGTIRVNEVFSASPPLAGEPIDLQDPASTTIHT
jgi:hypothetical protein